MTKRFLIIIIVLGFCTLSNAFTIKPKLLSIKSMPGVVQAEKITIFNNEVTTLNLQLQVLNWRFGENNQIEITTANISYSAKSWLKVPVNLAISPGQAGQCEVLINVPEQIHKSHRAVIRFVPWTMVSENVEIDYEKVEYCLLVHNLLGAIKSLEIGEIQYVMHDKSLDLQFKVSNNGEGWNYTSGFVIISDIDGLVVGKKKIDDFHFFPKESRSFKLAVPYDLPLSKVGNRLKVVLLVDDEKFAKETPLLKQRTTTKTYDYTQIDISNAELFEQDKNALDKKIYLDKLTVKYSPKSRYLKIFIEVANEENEDYFPAGYITIYTPHGKKIKTYKFDTKNIKAGYQDLIQAKIKLRKPLTKGTYPVEVKLIYKNFEKFKKSMLKVL